MKMKTICIAALLIVLTGCTSEPPVKEQTDEGKVENSDQENENAEAEKEEPAQEEASTPEEVIAEIEKQLSTDVPIKLPETLKLNEGYHLTAKTDSDQDSYQAIFFQTEEVIPINDAKLDQLSDDSILAVLTGQNYESKEAASEQISYQNFEQIGGEPVDLGYSITGYQDAGAGSVFLSWNEGRWAFTSRARTEDSDILLTESKKIVEFLESNMLPPPKMYGSGKFDTISEHSRDQILAWQEDQTVYKIEKAEGALKTLEIAVSIK
ncbi:MULTISPECIES: hypothetical protein [unclassified Cytobacillus]|uniref:hypothetical protein n=1 Tax=unclassified Cytobacillus TaxID=2675268 RepID=UPI002040014F|nr:hypothetical protein [Cytobacillus sp. AMY 15.2]MCM3091015.1 hypothetical protein [Cytobacillus sp. AMY 15.2]